MRVFQLTTQVQGACACASIGASYARSATSHACATLPCAGDEQSLDAHRAPAHLLQAPSRQPASLPEVVTAAASSMLQHAAALLPPPRAIAGGDRSSRRLETCSRITLRRPAAPVLAAAAGQQTISMSCSSAAAAPGPSTGSMEAATSCAAPSDLASPDQNFPMVSVSWPGSSMAISQKLGIHFVYIKHIAETASKRASRQYKLVHRRPRGRRTARPEGGERAGQKHEATRWLRCLLGF